MNRQTDALAKKILVAICLFVAACATSHGKMRVGNQDIFTLTIDHANSFLLPTPDGKLLLIDSGFPKNAAALAKQIRDEGFAPENVAVIIVTHAHHDHAGAARYFQEHFGTKIVGGRGDAPLFAAGKMLDQLCPTDFIARHRVAEDQSGTFPPVTPDVWIDSNTPLLPIAHIDGTIFPLPGHTKGSLVVAIGDALFVGDLFRGTILGSGATRHFYMCDEASNTRDILRLVDDLAPQAAWYFPGHFGPVKKARVREAFAK